MLVVLQHPIADLRRLAAKKPAASFLRVPGSTAETGIVDSLRYFGWADLRLAGADAAFPDETCFYSSHRALRFPGLGKRMFARNGVEIAPKIGSSRRLYVAQERLPVRVEVGVNLTALKAPLEFDDLIRFLKTILSLPTEIPEVDPGARAGKAYDNIAGERPLAAQNRALALHFALATTAWTATDLRLAAKLVRPCQPALAVEFRHGEIAPREIANRIPFFRRLDREHTRGVDVWYGQLATEGSTVPAWLLAPGIATPETVRSLRICLLRLHAEHGALDRALQWHDQEPRPPVDGENWKRYLRHVRKDVIDRERRGGIGQSALVEAIDAVAAAVPQSRYLEERLAAAEVETFGVVQGRPRAEEPEAPWKGWLKEFERKPDLAVVIERRNGSGRLAWTVWSPGEAEPQPAEEMAIVGSPEEFAKAVMNALQAVSGGPGLYGTLRGVGSFIGQRVPASLWGRLAEAARALGRPPSVLVLSDEPLVPWELARDPSSQDSPLLAVQAVIGRWRLADARPGMQPPPATLRIDSAAFVSGHYTGKNGYKPLPGAEREVEQVTAALTERTPPARVVRIEASESALVAFLSSKPEARLLHFSMHGRFDPAFRENGLITIEAKPVSFFLVRSSKLPAGPFVFLNACQVGLGQEILGGFAGMPDAFLTAGAAAVVAPIWAVDDEISHRIAIDFYQAALAADGGDGNDVPSVAELLRRVRAGFTRETKSPTCLAYQLFGHPELRLELGELARDAR